MELKAYAEELRLVFFSTPFDLVSASFLNKIQPVFKIASGDNNFLPLIDLVATFGKPIIISTGLLNYSGIVDLLKFYKSRKQLSAELIGRGGAWLDTGSIDDFYKTSAFVSAIENRQGFKIACLEEISLNKKWIKKNQIIDAIKFYGNCEYSVYLRKLIS